MLLDHRRRAHPLALNREQAAAAKRPKQRHCGRRAAAAVALILCVASAACGSSSTSQHQTTGGSTPPAPSTLTMSTANAPPDATTLATASTKPKADEPSAAGWIVGSERGIEHLSPTGTTRKLLAGPVATVAVGPDGTIFFQRRSPTDGSTTSAEATVIMALDRRSGLTRTVVEVDDADSRTAGWLQLDGVAIVQGRLQLIVRRWRHDPARPYEQQSWIELVRIDTRDGSTTTPIVVGGWETGTTAFSYGGGLLVATFQETGSLWPAVFTLGGERRNGIGPLQSPHTCSSQAARCPDALTVSADGSRLAWIESPTDWWLGGRSRLDIVVVDIASGEELTRAALPPNAGATQLTFRGRDELTVTRRFRETSSTGDSSTRTVSGALNVIQETFTAFPIDGIAAPDSGS